MLLLLLHLSHFEHTQHTIFSLALSAHTIGDRPYCGEMCYSFLFKFLSLPLLGLHKKRHLWRADAHFCWPSRGAGEKDERINVPGTGASIIYLKKRQRHVDLQLVSLAPATVDRSRACANSDTIGRLIDENERLEKISGRALNCKFTRPRRLLATQHFGHSQYSTSVPTSLLFDLYSRKHTGRRN